MEKAQVEAVSALLAKPESFWREHGFAGGLEIHQQLDTRKKLFCRCPVGYLNTVPDARIVRHMRPTLSEMGEYDCTALMEFKTKKNVVYELFSDATCTYEMDDTPPFPVNPQALDIAIEISLLLHCSIVDEVHVTRKQYLDGSIPTGFQRTCVIGVNGWIPFRGRKLHIQQVNMEEDACREMSDIGHTIVFRTDRLSTPLVEIITEKELFTPVEMMEANRELGRVLRASGKVRRGIGSVRQDVNVSIAGGDRVEIKGVQRYQRVERLTAVEAMRQKALLDMRAELQKRGVSAHNLRAVEKIFGGDCRALRSPLLTALLQQGQVVGAVKLEKFAGLFAREVAPGRPMAEEFADRVRVIACLDSRPNLLHSDDKVAGGLLPQDWEALASELSVRHDDALLLVFGSEVDVKTALEEIKIRARDAAAVVPRETRQDFGGGITGFERLLPGPDRMYPDTDSEPVKVTAERVEKIRRELPPRPWEKEEALAKLGLSASFARQLADSGDYPLLWRLAQENRSLVRPLASLISRCFPWLRRRQLHPQLLSDDVVLTLAHALQQGSLAQETLPELLTAMCREPGKAESLLRQSQAQLIADEKQLKKLVQEAVREAAKRCAGKPHCLADASMGKLLRANKGRICSAKVWPLVQAELTAQKHR